MFANRKRRASIPSLTVLSEDGSVLYQGSLQMLPIRESCILNCCIEYYDDYDPCFIHRTAAANRLLYELENTLRQSRCEQIEAIRSIFDTKSVVAAVKLDTVSATDA